MLQVRGQPSNANGILGDYWYFLIRGALEGDNFITEYIVLTNVNQEPIPLRGIHKLRSQFYPIFRPPSPYVRSCYKFENPPAPVCNVRFQKIVTKNSELQITINYYR